MVNETRRSILRTIRKKASWISGESLSHNYNISRYLPLSEASLIPLKGILTVLQSLKTSGTPNPHFRWPGNITGLNLNRRKIVRLLKEIWEQNLCLTPSELCRDLTPYARFLHKHVRIRTRLNEIIEGIAQSNDTEGRLCLVSDSYTTRVLSIESIKLTISGERNYE